MRCRCGAFDLPGGHLAAVNHDVHQSDRDCYIHPGYASRSEPSQTSASVDETPNDRALTTSAQQRTVPTTPEQP